MRLQESILTLTLVASIPRNVGIGGLRESGDLVSWPSLGLYELSPQPRGSDPIR